MTRKPGLRTLRFRIAVTFLLGAFVVSVFVSGATYGLAHAFLTRQRLGSVTRQSYNALRFAAEYLANPSSDPSTEGLVDRLVRRLNAGGGDADVVVLAGGEAIASSVSMTRGTVPAALRRAVARGDVGTIVFGEDPRRVAFGSPVPQQPLQVFFVYSLQQLDATLSLLLRILAAVAAVATVAGAGLGLRLAGQLSQPLAQVSEAARRVAEGVLETRLEVTGQDELSLLAASFNEMARALQERIAREHRFVADVSHELRTPLTALKASIDYLVERADALSQPLRATANLASREVRSLQRLVNDLLELSRMETGAMETRDEEVELSDFAREVVRRRANGHASRVEAPPEGLVVRTDKHHLERVVGNLVENAVVHGEARDVEVTVAVRDGRPTIEVADHGPGVPPEDLNRMFDPFWRGDRARRRSASHGSGLGLAIARENAVLLGAEITASSVLSEGTRFVVSLPPDRYVGARSSSEP